MAEFYYRSLVDAPVEEAFAWHERPGAIERLIPPWQAVQLLHCSGTVHDGDRVTLRLRIGPFWRRWVASHRDYQEGRQFRDQQLAGPFARWVHTHRFTPQDDGRTLLEDQIEYTPPMGPLGSLLRGHVERNLRRAFAFRHARLRDDLLRHARYRDRPRLRIAMTGASGLVGGALMAFLTSGGHRVDPLVRRSPRPGANEIRWNPDTDEIDAAALEGTDAVVHLAGENVAGGRWTEARKRRILESRVGGTRLLAEALAKLDRKPAVLVAASAVGYYGDRGDEVLTEASSAGEGFLPEVARDWEAATAPAVDAGIRVVNLRIGVVLSGAGGALRKMLLPFRLGLGGRVGSGRQFMSWIALDDLVGVVHESLFNDTYRGPVNAVAPNAVTNADFARTLGRVLRRPTLFPLPAFAARLALGEMAQVLLLDGARVEPRVLAERGFEYLFPELEAALRSELGA